MPLEKSKHWYTGFSFLVAIIASSCASLPQLTGGEPSTCSPPAVTFCASDPSRGGMICINENGEAFLMEYPATENFVCMNPFDFSATMEFVKCRK